MVPLLLGKFAYPIDEGESGLKVRKLAAADDVMFIGNLPLCGIGQLLMDGSEVISF